MIIVSFSFIFVYILEKYSNSFEIFNVLGNAKHPGALNMLGKQYFFGLGVEVDHTTALELWMQSSNLGFLNGTYNAAMSYYNGEGIKLICNCNLFMP